jgi:hypothetical protein
MESTGVLVFQERKGWPCRSKASPHAPNHFCGVQSAHTVFIQLISVLVSLMKSVAKNSVTLKGLLSVVSAQPTGFYHQSSPCNQSSLRLFSANLRLRVLRLETQLASRTLSSPCAPRALCVRRAPRIPRARQLPPPVLKLFRER